MLIHYLKFIQVFMVGKMLSCLAEGLLWSEQKCESLEVIQIHEITSQLLAKSSVSSVLPPPVRLAFEMVFQCIPPIGILLRSSLKCKIQ